MDEHARKQIEDMVLVILETVNTLKGRLSMQDIAEALYTAGYQRQSDTAKEIFEEVHSILAAELHKAFEHSYNSDTETQRRNTRKALSATLAALGHVEKKYGGTDYENQHNKT